MKIAIHATRGSHYVISRCVLKISDVFSLQDKHNASNKYVRIRLPSFVRKGTTSF